MPSPDVNKSLTHGGGFKCRRLTVDLLCSAQLWNLRFIKKNSSNKSWEMILPFIRLPTHSHLPAHLMNQLTPTTPSALALIGFWVLCSTSVSCSLWDDVGSCRWGCLWLCTSIYLRLQQNWRCYNLCRTGLWHISIALEWQSHPIGLVDAAFGGHIGLAGGEEYHLRNMLPRCRHRCWSRSW